METTTEPQAAGRDMRVKERVANMLGDLGYDRKQLPDLLVEICNNFKRTKDACRPGPLTAEGYATVVTLYELFK